MAMLVLISFFAILVPFATCSNYHEGASEFLKNCLVQPTSDTPRGKVRLNFVSPSDKNKRKSVEFISNYIANRGGKKTDLKEPYTPLLRFMATVKLSSFGDVEELKKIWGITQIQLMVNGIMDISFDPLMYKPKKSPYNPAVHSGHAYGVISDFLQIWTEKKLYSKLLEATNGKLMEVMVGDALFIGKYNGNKMGNYMFVSIDIIASDQE